ncbi:MAG: MBL fold metallo-hydrolase [Gillisia sp.]
MERKKFIKSVSLAAATFAVPASAFSLHKSQNYSPFHASVTTNPALANVPGAEDYAGTPLDQKGLFINEEHVFWPGWWDVIKWKTTPNSYKEQKEQDTQRLKIIPGNSLDDIANDSITWLGHASYIIQLDGVRILVDPILTEPLFLKRYSELPFETSAFRDIDYILISHNHRDHCDKESIQLLAEQNPEVTWLCGLGLDSLLLRDWTGSKKIQAAGWYQEYQIDNAALKISYLPTRHWSRRGLFDTNASLWGAFLLESKGSKIYFGGDSGYGEHLNKTNELFGAIDYYIAGIGAFAPRWFMAPSHMHPEEAARSSNDLQAKNLIPMHFGTFDLSDEPLLEPAHLIQELKAQNAFDANLLIPAVGVALNVYK